MGDGGGGMGLPFLSTPLPASFLDPAIDSTLDPALDPVIDSALDPVIDSALDPSPTLSPTLSSTQSSTLSPTLPYHTSSVMCSEPQLTQRAFFPASRVIV